MLANATTLWYVTRGSGVVALLLLTVSTLLGVGVTLRWRGERWPRFAVATVHRNLTLLSIFFVIVHVVTTVADGYAPISITAAVWPFGSPYRPLWLGLGTVAFDLLLALVATSLARRWLTPKIWRAVHWLAYATWPIALLHAFGTGSDGRFGWLAIVGFASLGSVALAVLARAALGAGDLRLRAAATATALVTPLLIVLWYENGPSQHGWAKRAGTPTSILGHTRRTTNAALAQPPQTPPTSFVSALSGKVLQIQDPNGLVTVRLSLDLRGGPRGAARIDLRGSPSAEGVSMSASGVSFVPATTRSVYVGQVIGLDGSRVVADVHDRAGDLLRLSFDLRIAAGARSVSGVVAGSAQGGAG